MDWIRRIGRSPEPAAVVPAAPPPPVGVERTTPAVAAIFDRVSEDRSHAVLDLGPASDASLRVYSRFARWVRFADLSDAEISGGNWKAALKTLPPRPERPFDLVFAWDLLDRLEPDARPALIARLAEITSDDARLYVVVDSSGKAETSPLRFSLLDTDRMRYEPTGRPRPPHQRLLPAEVERLLEPFHVVRAITSQIGLREYVAIRRRKKD